MIRVRDFRAGDVDAVMVIQQHSVTASAWTREHYLMITRRQNDRRHALVIEEDGDVGGFIVGSKIGDEWEIENVAVKPDARRRGLGSHMVGEFINLAKIIGAKAIFLEVRESNRAAIALYEKWAFTEEGRRKSYYKDPEEDALVLKFSIPE
jgi:[ribosomal protein S18]-alanine N-acetyltransferase